MLFIDSKVDSGTEKGKMSGSEKSENNFRYTFFYVTKSSLCQMSILALINSIFRLSRTWSDPHTEFSSVLRNVDV